MLGGDGTRTSRSASTHERILDAALVAINRDGFDRVTVHMVADGAGVTTGAIYGRFENLNAVLASLWSERLRDECRARLERALQLGDLHAHDWNDVLDDRSVRALAASQFVSAARRAHHLERTVLSDLRAWWNDWGIGPDGDPVRRAESHVLLSFALGSPLTAAAVPHLQPDWRVVHDWWHASLDQRPQRLDAAPAPRRLRDLHVPGDNLADALLRAAMDVVAELGVEAATLTRIARAAGVKRSSYSSQFSSRDELVLAAFRQAIWVALGTEHRREWMFHDDTAAEVMRAWMQPDERGRRGLRLETYLAAINDRSLARELQHGESDSEAELVAVLGASGAADEAARTMLRTSRAMLVGMCAIHEAIGGGASIDWRYVLSPLIVQAREPLAAAARSEGATR